MGWSSMFGLSHLFYPWGFVLQILAIVHFIRLRPEMYWLYIILLGGVLGASVYIGAEVLPDVTLLRGVIQGFGQGLLSRHAKHTFWIIPRPETTMSVATFTLNER